MYSIPEEKKKPSNLKVKKFIPRLLSILFWIGIWQILSMQERLGIFVASPFQTLQRFVRLAGTGRYWTSVLYTSGRILGGFLPAVLISVLLLALTSRFGWLDTLLMPVMRFARTVPVVSFIILALILFSSRYLTQLIACTMALPVIYMNLKTGIRQTDRNLTEMAALFRVSRIRMVRYLYLPSVMPAFETCTVLALGFAWKSGIAAEVIGMPAGSIGERLQQAKVYLDTPDLFAWTLTLVLLSVITEKLWKALLRGIQKYLLYI